MIKNFVRNLDNFFQASNNDFRTVSEIPQFHLESYCSALVGGSAFIMIRIDVFSVDVPGIIHFTRNVVRISLEHDDSVNVAVRQIYAIAHALR